MSAENVDKVDVSELKLYAERVRATLKQTQEEIERWRTYSADYEASQNTLLKLPEETSYEVMVPLGKLAFMPGKLIHTNEVLALLGDNWFAERSCKQAVEIIGRRKEMVDQNIKTLEDRLKDLKQKFGLTPELFGTQETGEVNEEGLKYMEIREEYNPEEEEKERPVTHRVPTVKPQKSEEELKEDQKLLNIEEEEEEEPEEEGEGDEEDDEDEEEEEEEEAEQEGGMMNEPETSKSKPVKKVTFSPDVVDDSSDSSKIQNPADIYRRMLSAVKKSEAPPDLVIPENEKPQVIDNVSSSTNENPKPKKVSRFKAARMGVESSESELNNIPQVPSKRRSKDIPQVGSVMKGAVVEKEGAPTMEEDIEEDMLMREVTNEYHRRRQDFISANSGFASVNNENLEYVEPNKPAKKVSKFKAARLGQKPSSEL
ncbi:hypothetical protein K493DRAFT_309958 [Basidiobolus meristosporus CBS 931.73]|uniref:DUF3835 domain-containing protein n=1 Tax=Basidiobolus meristosporus CBS 931.73 TaxID=1314790 RepID=A0A1Y1ZD85_9FUNG|nr:hypothetical protein K493DRAFT_309958 [Basidiobolus meristosporus CBS 931.73]|eukprot:ORY08166.1 hypothetical protein K493DRAFT_309958 [Basidiobolus meristosporus CBS 931.73]